jgi:hypothetical protein
VVGGRVNPTTLTLSASASASLALSFQRPRFTLCILPSSRHARGRLVNVHKRITPKFSVRQKEIVYRAIGVTPVRWSYGKGTISADKRIVISSGVGALQQALGSSFQRLFSNLHNALETSPAPFAAPLLLCLIDPRGS